MHTIKVQINHKETITINELATLLFNQIGEEYDLSLEDIKEYFLRDVYCWCYPSSFCNKNPPIPMPKKLGIHAAKIGEITPVIPKPPIIKLDK